MTKFIQLLISGLSLGSIYGLIALGFVLVYKATRVFNFAQGDLMMVGAFALVLFDHSLGLPTWLAVVLALASAAAVGVAFQYVFVRPLAGQDFLPIVMATIGASLIIEAIVQIGFGVQDITYQTSLPSNVWTIGGVHIASLDVITIGIAAFCLTVFTLFFRFTDIGLQMRGAAENGEAAALSGVNVRRVTVVAWIVGTLLAFIGGLVLANTTQVVNVPLAGLGLLAFPAVVIGGLESVPGAVLGGVVVGVLQDLGAGYISIDAQTPLVYAALLIMLLIRPYGLFGEKEIRRV